MREISSIRLAEALDVSQGSRLSLFPAHEAEDQGALRDRGVPVRIPVAVGCLGKEDQFGNPRNSRRPDDGLSGQPGVRRKSRPHQGRLPRRDGLSRAAGEPAARQVRHAPHHENPGQGVHQAQTALRQLCPARPSLLFNWGIPRDYTTGNPVDKADPERPPASRRSSWSGFAAIPSPAMASEPGSSGSIDLWS